jgi:hypothetical protein
VAHPPIRNSGRPGAPQKSGTQPTLEDGLALKRASEVLSDEAYQTEEDLEALKARYEMYFLGIEKREPTRERWEMKRRVERLKESFTKNTGLRFRLQTLHARFLSYERLWMRSAREKEEGTYRRDIFKARLRAKEAGKASVAPAPEGSREKAPGAPPAAHRAAATPSAPATFSGTSEPQLRALFDAYVEAKRSCKEDVSRLSYESLAKSVQKQVPELMTRFKARSVDFRVEVKDGRAVLKAIPRV